jgi:redox-sensitive bicupin YhaK (pirin superfamily)
MVSGKLRHTDNIGNSDVLNPGEVQVMSAGSGIMHSEANDSPTLPLRLLQIWIEPRTKRAKPRWEQKSFEPGARVNRLLPVVSAGDVSGTLWIDQDAVIYVSSLAGGKSVIHTTKPGRRAYVFVIAGHISLNGHKLTAGDQARVSDEITLSIDAQKDSELILLDLP